MAIAQFMEKLWQSYIEITPQAEAIQKLFSDRGEKVMNDHVAFRTFNKKGIDLEVLSGLLENNGYKKHDTYHFEEKKLRAYSFLPSEADQPYIFVSELLTEQLSGEAQQIIRKLVAQIPKAAFNSLDLFTVDWREPELSNE